MKDEDPIIFSREEIGMTENIANITNDNGQVVGQATVMTETQTTTEPAKKPEEEKVKWTDKFRHSWIWTNRGKIGAALGSIATLGIMAFVNGRRGDDDDDTYDGPEE